MAIERPAGLFKVQCPKCNGEAEASIEQTRESAMLHVGCLKCGRPFLLIFPGALSYVECGRQALLFEETTP